MITIAVHKVRATKFFPLAGWLIMLFQGMWPWGKDSYNHIELSYIDEAGHERFFGSTGKLGFEERSEHTFLRTNKIIETVYLDIPANRVDLLDWIYDNDPIAYDKAQIYGLFLKCIGFLTFNKYGKNFKKLTCNEVYLKLLKDFKGLCYGDPDNFDLIMTWEIILKHGRA